MPTLSLFVFVSVTCWWHHNRSDSGHSETIATTGAAAMSTVTSGTVPARHFCHLSSSPSSLPKCNTDQPDSNAVGEPVLHEERVSLLNARYVTF